MSIFMLLSLSKLSFFSGRTKKHVISLIISLFECGGINFFLLETELSPASKLVAFCLPDCKNQMDNPIAGYFDFLLPLK